MRAIHITVTIAAALLVGCPASPDAGSPASEEAPAEPSPWPGRYENADLKVVITPGADRDHYGGSVTRREDTYPLDVSELIPGKLTGTFELDGDPFECSIELTDWGVDFVFVHQTYHLKRMEASEPAGEPPADPPAKPKDD